MKNGQKRICRERSGCTEGIYTPRQQEYQIIMELSGRFPVSLLCKLTGMNRSSFYNRKYYLSHPSEKTRKSIESISLFRAYHLRYPSHGYRWLNAKIRLDTGLILSDLQHINTVRQPKSRAKRNAAAIRSREIRIEFTQIFCFQRCAWMAPCSA